jgi:Uma2 family endonuclease
MAMTPTRVVLTYRDYAALPSDGRRYEIREGELSVTAAPRTRHQEIIGNLFAALRAHVIARGLGKVFVSPIAVIERGIEGPPTLVVEILSPTTAQIDRTTKMQLYARHGVPWYWIVDPDSRTVEVYGLVEGGYTLSAEPLADLVIPPASLWA